MPKKKSKHNYIDNEQLLQDILRWKAEPDYETKIPNYIGKYIVLIVDNLAKSGNFSGYSWLQEMKDDAIVTICRYIRNFNPEISSNPFAYFTKLAYHSFQSRIGLEKRYLEALSIMKEDAEEIYHLDNMTDEHGNIMEKVKQKDMEYVKERKYIKPRVKKYNKKINNPIDRFLETENEFEES